MEISKSTPYVRYRENISSTLHKGTIHIESEYLDRERKTTIESIEGQTWQNMVNGENKEEEILPRLGLKIEGNEDILDSVEQHMPIDTIIGDVEPVANEDGTYTYEISTMEGSYAKTLDGENNFSLTSDGLVGDMYIKYNAQGEEVNGSIVMDNWQSSYTIENSSNGEIKSAILKGQTLVNINRPITRNDNMKVENGLQILTTWTTAYNLWIVNDITLFKTNTKYYIIAEVIDNTLTSTWSPMIGSTDCVFSGSISSLNFASKETGIKCATFTTKSDFTGVICGLRSATGESEVIGKTLKYRVMIIEYQEGMENWNIPYFQGMQSVKMPVLTTTGKNLFDGEIELGYIDSDGTLQDRTTTVRTKDYVRVIPNEFYTLSNDMGYANDNIYGYDENYQFVQRIHSINGRSENVHYIKFRSSNTNVENNLDVKYQLEIGTTATDYEPYKSNILTVNEEVTLRGIGDVRDELDLETGVLTQRIGEIVLNGSEKWNSRVTTDGYMQLRTSIEIDIAHGKYNKVLIANKLPAFPASGGNKTDEWIIRPDNTTFNIELKILASRLESASVESFKEWLSKNPITVQYQLATESIKTVDLTVTDQDDKIIQSLHTHPSTTHINLSSDGLIPNVELSYTMYGNIGETTGEKITDGTDSKLIEGKVYGDTLLNVLPSPSLKNSMDYNTSTQKLNNGYDNINVVDGEFKKATLYGQTLVNLINLEKFTSDSNMLYTYELPVKNNTTYTVIATLKGSDKIDSTRESVLRIKSNDNNGSELIGTQQIEPNNTSAVINIFSTIEVTTQNNLYIRLFNTLPKNLKLLIIEGDYTNKDIPYFEGMQSVAMPSVKTCGKNLFHSDIEVFNNNNYIRTGNDINIACDTELKPSTTYTLSWNGNNRDGKIRLYSNGVKTNSIDIGWHKSDITFTTSEVEDGFSFYTQLSDDSSLTSDMSFNVQLEEGTTATSYELYQSNILTVNEDIELRAVGNVRDELDCVTGEVTQRIGEVVLDGSQDGLYNYTSDESLGLITLRINKIPDIKNTNFNLYGLLSDKYVSVTNQSPNNIMAYNTRIMITKPISELESFNTPDKIKLFLSQNPITLQYPLQTSITKTIDLTIQDQDNQPQTALHTFANGYINTSSQGLLPKVDYEVSTSNSYYLDMVKPNTQYTTKSSLDCNATIDGTTYPLSANGTFTTPSTITNKTMVLDAQVDDLMFIEGDLTGRELDYFTGLQSVDMPVLYTVGKNLFNCTNVKNINNSYTVLGMNSENYIETNTLVKKGKQYTLSLHAKIGGSTGNALDLGYINYSNVVGGVEKGTHQMKFINSVIDEDITITFVALATDYIKINIRTVKINYNVVLSNVQLEESGVATIFEPHQSSITTTQQPIALHRIGDVKDELDLVNECVTKYFGKIIFDGSVDEDWTFKEELNGKLCYAITMPEDMKNYGINNYKKGFVSDKFNSSTMFTGYFGGRNICFWFNASSMPKDVKEIRKWFSKNPTTVIYELATPTTEPVRIVPQNPKQSTTSLTLQSPLQKIGNVADQLRWNPYKGHYVRYNYIQDGVANSTYTFEDLKDMNERKFVNLYNQRTYIDTDHTVQVISHGISRYCLAEQGKQYQVRWDWAEEPSVDTIKVDLCGNVKEIPSGDNSVVIDVEKFTHQFIQIQGLGLTGKITNLMVIETVNGEIPDVDFFSGIQCVGNTVNIDGNAKVQIDMEQTNGNLIDIIPTLYNNGNNLQFLNIPVKYNCQYHISNEVDSRGYNNFSVHFLKEINGSSQSSKTIYDSDVFNVPFGCKYISIYRQTSEKGNANIYHGIDLHYADMDKDKVRPRYYDKESIILPMKLCRVGNIYDNLYYDDLKGYYRIQQSIGHKYFTGETTEVWTMETTNGYRTIKFTCTSANIDQIAYGETICNSFKHLSTINDDMEGFIIYNGNFVLRIDKDRLTDKTVDGFKALLASNQIHLFYQLKTPQMINLTEYPNRIEFNTYRDEIFTFFKGMNPTKFTLSVPMDKTYRYEIAEEGQGLANRVTVNNETISAENVVAVKEVRGQGIANIIEDVDNVVITPRPNHGAVATSHTLNNTKPATIRVHGFEASGETAIGTYNVTNKAYQLKVMSSNGDNSLSDYYVLNVPYKLETYADGTKDMVYYDEAYKQWIFKGLSVKQYTVASDGMLNETVEVFRGLAPRSGMIVEFKLRFTSGTTTARFSYSTNGVTYNSLSLRGMSDGNYLYVAFFNTGGTKIDMARKTDPNAEYELLSFLPQVPECLMVNQIQNCEFCEVTINKQYIYSEMNSPIELDTYDGTTKVFMDGNATDTNIIIRNDATTKIVNTYTDTEYTVYWKYVDGLGNLRITLGGTTVEVDGKQEYATIKTQLNAPQELLYVGGYNLSIKDLMVVKGAKIDDLPYFEGSRQVGTLVLDEEGNKSYKITLVQGGSVLEQRDEDAIAFKDDNKHNVVVHKIVGVCPTKVD